MKISGCCSKYFLISNYLVFTEQRKTNTDPSTTFKTGSVSTLLVSPKKITAPNLVKFNSLPKEELDKFPLPQVCISHSINSLYPTLLVHTAILDISPTFKQITLPKLNPET